MTSTFDLSLAGPSEPDWLASCAALDRFEMPAATRVVVVSPHPDDETLGVGGFLADAVDAGMTVHVISVTDGEAAFPDPGLAGIRRAELDRALLCLDPWRRITLERLGLPDGGLETTFETLCFQLRQRLRSHDLILCPLRDDGHPDHAAVGNASVRAAIEVGAVVMEFPIWAWHGHHPQTSRIRHGRRVELSAGGRRRKQSAIGCYQSQLSGASPVVPAAMVSRLDRPFEVLVAP